MPLLLPTKQVVIMFILMFVGWICYQVKFLHEQTVKDLTKILLYVVSPCLIINSFRQTFSVTRLVQFSLIFYSLYNIIEVTKYYIISEGMN